MAMKEQVLNLKKREVKYDNIRLIALFFMISVHIISYPSDQIDENSIPGIVTRTIFFTCNSLYFMLSGKFNLSIIFEKRKDYIKFYKKRAVTVFLPFLVLSFLLYIYECVIVNGVMSVQVILSGFPVKFFQINQQYTHLWFLYCLIGLIISTPFLSKMLHSMTDAELTFLVIIGFLWNLISIYCVADFNIIFGFNSWILNSWSLQFVLGYYWERMGKRMPRSVIYLVGISGGMVTILNRFFLPDHSANVYDLAPAHIIFSFFFFVLFQNLIKENSGVIAIVRLFIVRHSFSIYMIHYYILDKVMNLFCEMDLYVIRNSLRFGVVFIGSLFIACLLDVCIINPMKKLLARALHL